MCPSPSPYLAPREDGWGDRCEVGPRGRSQGRGPRLPWPPQSERSWPGVGKESSRVRRGQEARSRSSGSHLVANFCSKLCLPVLIRAHSQAGCLRSWWKGCPRISPSQLAEVHAYLSHTSSLSTCCILSGTWGITWELMERHYNWGTPVPRFWDGRWSEAP